ncbi:protein translocase subunit SecF [Sinanaerobacter sp. ZZT-01]|uniref:protein translocase subunit SecF n=1 Tax=Sinanaerobacter sp. ZZT-01 TaxID=3111540 RepID=UPI002D788929|nr:protein translocase subunit SecF [Sinanaerobacter sp. ZZT-01]WRR93159.1 protein translocase subunit SecF [Sinanaerobacter sp. ZZT-01]
MFVIKKELSFIKHRKIFYIISLVLIIAGIGTGLIRGFNFGIDFTGGTRIQFDMGREVSIEEVQSVLDASNIEAEVQHAGENNDQIVLKTVQALDNDARTNLYENMFSTFDLDKDSVANAQLIGPSVGDLLKKNAIKAVLIASICMLIYIIIRFEWKFGVASIVALLHDVLMLIAFYGLFHVSINNPFIAGMLIVVGYSINDTIVVFDRIRENLKFMRKKQLEELVDKSINQTLVRSLMTSITTILVIIPLYIICGDTIREFALPLIVGITAGAYSSITIASPLYYDLTKLTEKKSKYKGK